VGKQNTYLVIPVSSSDMKFLRIGVKWSNLKWNWDFSLVYLILFWLEGFSMRTRPAASISKPQSLLTWLSQIQTKGSDWNLLHDWLVKSEKNVFESVSCEFFSIAMSRDFDNLMSLNIFGLTLIWIYFDESIIQSKFLPIRRKFWFWLSLTVNLLS
jgi:hypothetical protein